MENSKVFIITGGQGKGKTTFLKSLLPELKRVGIKATGFYAEGQWKNDVRVRFDIVDIQSQESRLLCSDEAVTGYEKVQRFYFNPETIRWAEHLLMEENQTEKYLFVLDEIGKFEIAKKVWHYALSRLLEMRRPVLITVRGEILEQVIEYFQMRNPIVFELDHAQKKVAQTIAGQL